MKYRKVDEQMIRIHNAILHIFDTNTNEGVLSQNELDFKQPFVHSYIEAMVDKIMNTSKQKSGELTTNNSVNEKLQNLNENFIEASHELTMMFYDLIKVNPEIPTADLLWVQFEMDDFQFIGMFKLNHSESYTHYVDYEDDALRNDLIIHRAILPNAKQAIDEGLIFCPSTNEYFLIEKKHRIEETDDRLNYLSELFLKIEPAPSMQDNLNVVKKAVQKTAKQFLEPEYESLANAKEVLYQAVNEDAKIDNKRIAEELYGDNVAKKQAYFEQTEELGFVGDSPYDPHLMSNRMRKQKLKLDNGIEISIPLELFNDTEVIQITNNPDGTVSVLLKNIENIKNLF